jgi:hypothetical protein
MDIQEPQAPEVIEQISLPSRNSLPARVLTICLVLVLIVGAFVIGARTEKVDDTEKEITQKAFATPTIPFPTPIPLSWFQAAVPTYDYAGWRSETLSLYSVSVSLPEGWVLQEVDRRPEPLEEYNERTGHDCANYLIMSSDGYMKLNISPVCGFADGGGYPLVSDAVIVKSAPHANEGGVIARVLESGDYIYGSAGEVSIEDENGKRKEVYFGRYMSFSKDDPGPSGTISGIYSGPEDLRESYLKISDQIVASFAQ